MMLTTKLDLNATFNYSICILIIINIDKITFDIKLGMSLFCSCTHNEIYFVLIRLLISFHKYYTPIDDLYENTTIMIELHILK